MAFPFLSKLSRESLTSRLASNRKSPALLGLVSLMTLTAAAVMFVPVQAETAGDATKGLAVFTKNNCAVCHPGGDNTMDPGHPIKGAAFTQKYKDDAMIEATVRKGFPQYGMPSFTKAMINERDMKDLIAYVRSLSKNPKSPK